MLFLNSWRASNHAVRYDTNPPADSKTAVSTDTQGKLRLNLHSLSVSELLEYRRKSYARILKARSHSISGGSI
jgi:hypothetical protein